MASMYPNLDSSIIDEYIGEHSEAHVYRKLSEMSDGFHVYHSVRYVDFTYSSGKPEGECDFVILHKHKGLLVLEVKGGHIVCEDGTWYSRGKRGKHVIAPYQQARDNEHVIVDTKLRKERGVREAFPYGYAVCFPHCKVPTFSESLRNSTLESKDITLGASDLTNIEEGIDQIMRKWAGDRRKKQITKPTFRKIEKVLKRRFELVPSYSSRINSLNEHLIALDKRQIQFLEFLQEHNRAAISGAAGSGKTILAVEKARRLAEDDNEVLFLTYNRPLAEKLADDLTKLDHVNVSNVHRWGLSLIRQSGVGSGVPELRRSGTLNDRFFREKFPSLLWEAIEHQGMSLDAIVLDEGQDYEPEVLLCLEEALKDKGYFYVFYDPKQDVYDTYQMLDLPSPPYPLPYNYRSPKRLIDFVNDETRISVKSSPNSITGHRPEIVRVTKNRLRKKIEAYVKELTERGIDAGTICIIVQNADRFMKWWDSDSISGYHVAAAELPIDRETIRVVSLKRFKGLECQAVALCEVQGISDVLSDPKEYYVALTRAKFDVRVFKTRN